MFCLNIGCKISLEKIPAKKLESDELLFSESHSRYLIVLEKKNLTKIIKILSGRKLEFADIGKFEGTKILFKKNSTNLVNLSVDKARLNWLNSLEELVVHG